MNLTHTAYLLQQYQTGKATDAEWEELAALLANAGNDETIKEALQQAMEQHTTGDAFLHRDYQALLQKITGIDQLPAQNNPPVRRTFYIRRWGWMAAAAVLLLTGGAVYLRFNKQQSVKQPVLATTQKEIVPGHQGAVLTLANGQTIVLDSLNNGVVAQQGATTITLKNGVINYEGIATDNAAIANNTLTTPRGRQYQLTLPDGTKVWLNTESSITYPVTFTGNNRSVSITGEAYFEVAKDKSKPFIVNVAGKNSVEVLGTHFNVNAYSDEKDIKTTLLEGAVRVSAIGPYGYREHPAIVLKPGEQSIHHTSLTIHNSTLTINHSPHIETVLAWKNGLFVLQGANLEEVIRQLARWYDIDISYEGTVPEKAFDGTISRNSNLSEVLKVLERNQVHFRLDGKKLVVTP